VTTSEKYVTAAYLVFFGVVLVYVLIIAAKLARLQRDVAELARLIQDRHDG
jgi:hypothetical protein